MENTNYIIKEYNKYAKLVLNLEKILKDYTLDEFEISVKSLNIQQFKKILKNKMFPSVEINTIEGKKEKYYAEFSIELSKSINYNIKYIINGLEGFDDYVEIKYFLIEKFEKDKKYLILNRERSYTNLMFWKQNQHGYTDCLGKAGIFKNKEINKIDFRNKKSIPIPLTSEENIIGITMEDIETAKYFESKEIKVILWNESDLNGKRLIEVVQDL